MSNTTIEQYPSALESMRVCPSGDLFVSSSFMHAFSTFNSRSPSCSLRRKTIRSENDDKEKKKEIGHTKQHR